MKALGRFTGTNNLTANAKIKDGETIVQTAVIKQTGNLTLYDRTPYLDTGWTVYSGNTYQKTWATAPTVLWMEDSIMTEGSDKDLLNDHEWIHDTGVLYFRDDSQRPNKIEVDILVKKFPAHSSSILTPYHFPEGLHFVRSCNAVVTGTVNYSLSYC